MKANIVVLPGDGVGPEVTAAAMDVLDVVAKTWGHAFAFTELAIGGRSIDEYGTALTQETLGACIASNAVLLGAVGGPKWEVPKSSVRPEQGLLALRKGLGVFANLRPVKPYAALINASPLKPELLRGVDLLVVRELTGGVYFGQPKGREKTEGRTSAVDTMRYDESEIERIVRLGFQLASQRRKKLSSVDKANVLETSRLWRETVEALRPKFPDVTVEHMLVDTAAMQLVLSPSRFDVIVTENMFGDILTDEAAVLAGSIGLLPSASLGTSGPGLYEPIHGSAPDIAGTGKANPVGAILSAAMLLRHSLGLETEALAVEQAVAETIAGGRWTMDLGGTMTTKEMTAAISGRFEKYTPVHIQVKEHV